MDQRDHSPIVFKRHIHRVVGNKEEIENLELGTPQQK